MKFTVELGICESCGGDVGPWYTLLFQNIEVPDEETGQHTEQQLEDHLLDRARMEAELDLSATNISIAHSWLYAYERMEEPA